ncbi:MFS transporter [Sphingopyxis lindanitolerans]|uniref:MFS transporter n=1 Tax=Sphingopyxis lindanitolerans TaxID=2054227 RepID=UPI00130501F7|nr:MFS transporter [Sphingopyxis lindanitolerans]
MNGASAPKRSIGRLVVALMMVEMISSFENSMTITALPTIARQFNDIAHVGWLITGFVLVQAGTAAVGGRLGDIYGRRRMLAIIAILCAAGSVVSALATTLEGIIIGRAIQGVSGALLPLCFGIVREYVPQEKVAFWVGCLSGAYAVGAGLGNVLAGFLVDLGGWHTIFLFTAGYSVLALIPLATMVPETTRLTLKGQTDYLGGLLFVPAVALTLYGFGNISSSPFLSVTVAGCSLIGLGLIALWAWHESRHPEPLIDVRLLANRDIALANLCYALLGLGMVQMPIISMMLLQQPVWTGIGLGVTATIAGIVKTPTAFGSAVASPLSGYISGRFGGRASIVTGSALGIVGWGGLTLFHDSIALAVMWMTIGVAAIAMLLAAVPNIVLAHVPLSRSSEATGLSMVVKGIFAGVGAQAVTAILGSRSILGADGTAYPSREGFMLCLGLTTGTAVLILLTGLTIGRGKPTPAAEENTVREVAA